MINAWALVHWDMRGHLIGLERYQFKYKAEREARQRSQRPFNRQHDIWFVMPWKFRPPDTPVDTPSPESQ